MYAQSPGSPSTTIRVPGGEDLRGQRKPAQGHLHVLLQLRHGLVAVVRIAGHRALDDPAEADGERGGGIARREGDHAGGGPVEAGGDVFAVEGRHAGQDVVEHRAQAEHVGPLVEPIARAHRLLGRHERRRSAGSAPHVEVRVAGDDHARHLVGHAARRPDDRQSPVDQVDLSERSRQDVARLDVAVQDAAAVGEGDGLADLEKGGHHLAQRLGETGLPPGARAPVGQGVPLDPLHREVAVPLAIDADLVHGRDVRVIELRRNLRLADEPLDLARPGGQIGRQDLHGGDAQEAEIADGVNRPHPPGADGVEVLIPLRHALARRRLGAGYGRRTTLRLPGNSRHLVAADDRLLAELLYKRDHI